MRDKKHGWVAFVFIRDLPPTSPRAKVGRSSSDLGVRRLDASLDDEA